jgi:hypothetical protein
MTDNELEVVTVSVSDDVNIKYMVEDLRTAMTLPYPTHYGDLPEEYKNFLETLAAEMISYGWKKPEV